MKFKLFTKDRLDWGHLKWALLVLFLVWMISWVVLYFSLEKETFAYIGSAVNGLFSAMAFVSLVLLLFLQRNDQRGSLDDIQQLRTQIEKQNSIEQQKSFEQRFFKLLELLETSVRTIDISSDGKSYSGRDSFTILYNHLVSIYKAEASQNPDLPVPERIDKAFDEFIQKCPMEINRYFQTLFFIIEEIDSTAGDNEAYFVQLFRTQLCTAEQLLVFYYIISSKGRTKLKGLVKKHKILTDLPAELLDKQHLALYRLE